MKIYLVGGAVRDQLLGLPIKERDWVVVGATAQDMIKLGYRQVGKDFPVFLHPKTHDEYALARTERKVGRGYTGFEFDTSQTVTLEEDLLRRDLTINAIAQDENGQLIDPYHGQADLAQKILRHVSLAFAEDPVRILRTARFAARFDFSIAPDTMTLMKSMVASGEVNALVAERVWKELERALLEPYPERFFEVLQACGALAVLFPQPLDCSRLAKTDAKIHLRFAALLHKLSITEANTFCDAYRVPNDCRELALLLIRYLNAYIKVNTLSAADIYQLLANIDAFRREQRFLDFLAVCSLYGTEKQAHFLLNCFNAAKTINTQHIATDLVGKAIADKIKILRIDAIKNIKTHTLDF